MNQAFEKIYEENGNKIKLNKEKHIYNDSDKNKLENRKMINNKKILIECLLFGNVLSLLHILTFQ